MITNPKLASMAVIALSIFAAPIAKAACGRAPDNNNVSPALRSPAQPLTQAEQNDSFQAALPGAQGDQKSNSTASILGLWKFVLYAGGELNDVGFEQFSAGGTELANDAGAFSGGNNFCVGSWQQVGPRSYDLVHPFFLFDGSNVIGISIERAHFLVSRDGNAFTGTWTQDNYDLFGTLIPGTHIDGTMSGTRIAPQLDYPYPLPL